MLHGGGASAQPWQRRHFAAIQAARPRVSTDGGNSFSSRSCAPTDFRQALRCAFDRPRRVGAAGCGRPSKNKPQAVLASIGFPHQLREPYQAMLSRRNSARPSAACSASSSFTESQSVLSWRKWRTPVSKSGKPRNVRREATASILPKAQSSARIRTRLLRLPTIVINASRTSRHSITPTSSGGNSGVWSVSLMRGIPARESEPGVKRYGERRVNGRPFSEAAHA